MMKLGALLFALALTNGCEMVCVVPPASGQVVDAHSGQPISHAAVSRICSSAPAKTTADKDGNFTFRGKRRLQIAIGDTIVTPHSYHIEAAGYHSVDTNGVSYIWANASGLRDNLGVIPMAPN
jgi:hypothetical protein